MGTTIRLPAATLICLSLLAAAPAQQRPGARKTPIEELRQEVADLRQQVEDLKQELAQLRARQSTPTTRPTKATGNPFVGARDPQVGMTYEQVQATLGPSLKPKRRVSDTDFEVVEWGQEIPKQGGGNYFIRKWIVRFEGGKVTQVIDQRDKDPGFRATEVPAIR